MNLRILIVVILSFVFGWQLGHRDVSVKWEKYTPSISVINRDVPNNINVDFKLF